MYSKCIADVLHKQDEGPISNHNHDLGQVDGPKGVKFCVQWAPMG